MSLIVPRSPAWSNCTTTMTGTPPGQTLWPGITITPGTSNADGSNTTLLTAIAHDVEYLVINVVGTSGSAVDGSCLLDILTDPAGGSTWDSADLISDLLCGSKVNAGSDNGIGSIFYHFPIWLKNGHSLGCRARYAAASFGNTMKVNVFAYGGNANPGSWWCGRTVESIAITAASSKGTDHTAGNSGTYSSWTNLGSTITGQAGAIQYGIGGTNSNTTANALGFYFEFGAGSTRIGPNFYMQQGTGEQNLVTSPGGPIFCNLPNATQLQVRGTCSGTAQAIDVAAYVVH